MATEFTYWSTCVWFLKFKNYNLNFWKTDLRIESFTWLNILSVFSTASKATQILQKSLVVQVGRRVYRSNSNGSCARTLNHLLRFELDLPKGIDIYPLRISCGTSLLGALLWSRLILRRINCRLNSVGVFKMLLDTLDRLVCTIRLLRLAFVIIHF